jgi:hypothetical protein
MSRTELSVQRVLTQLPFIEAELVQLLTNVDDCGHFEHLRLARERYQGP